MALSSETQEALSALDRLLALEQEEIRVRAEAQRVGKNDRELETAGVLLRGATIEDTEGALLGRVRVRLSENPARPGQLAAFFVRSGSVVFQRLKDDGGNVLLGPRGLVARRSARRLDVVFDELLPAAEHLDLLRDDDNVTLERLRQAVQEAGKREGSAGELVEVLLGTRAPAVGAGGELTFFDAALNADQQRAVTLATFCHDVALVHGPPGTGKTRVMVEIVRQLLGRGERVLALCASNAAVDHLALGILALDDKVALARVGHPARVADNLEARTLAGLTDDHELRLLAKRLLQEAFSILRNARKRKSRGREGWRAEREARAEAGKLFADARRLERQAVNEVLRTTRVLAGTLTGFARELPAHEKFDVLVVDEASQALTASLLSGAGRVTRMVLAGDHRQLPPTVLSPEAMRRGLQETAFADLIARDDQQGFAHMLTVQHRMHADLMAFPSSEFYDHALTAHPEVAGRRLHELLAADGEPTLTMVRADTAFEFLDTAGAGWEESGPGSRSSGASATGTHQSRSNLGEANLVGRVIGDLLTAGFSPLQIGVITPYAAHAALLTSQLQDPIEAGLEVDSVDGFQGREKEVIILSTVRSNANSEVGFLADARRLNVSITRAKRKLIVIGDSATLGADPLWNRLIEHAASQDAHRSVFEFGVEDL